MAGSGIAAPRQIGDPLLATKLGVQARRTRSVDRPRLRALMDEGREVRLVLVSAPAGFGKSTLLAEWLDAADVRGAWLSLDRGDNDVVRFSRYLAAAAALLTDASAGVPDLDTGPAFDPELALAGVLDALAAPADGGAAGGTVLVLDDYHLIDQASIHRLVGTLIERLPRSARLAIATRADPPLPLARLRARGELLEVRADDLRFTAAEAGELLRSAGVELAPGEVDTLTGRTEGWAAALRLAGVSLRARPDHEDLVDRFGASHRYVLDYIVEEVLAGLPSETQEFLLRTSILERLSGPLCEAVTGEPDAQARLEDLERANLLIVPLDDERRWYRYHALFAEILRARLAALRPDEVPGLHARASAWHEEQGRDDEAIAHALHAGDPERTSWIVAMASGRHLSAGELTTVRRWLDALPPDLVRGHAQLSASYAWCQILVGETEGVAERLADADRALAAGRDGGPAMRAGIPPQLALLRSQLAGFEGDAATALAQARLARELVPDGLPTEGVATLRGTATVLIASALLRGGRLAEAAEAYEAGIPDLRIAGNLLALGRALADQAGISIARGDAAAAVRLCEAELERGDAPSSAARSPAVWAALARARAELGQVGLAEAAARRSLELAARSGDAPSARSATTTLARIAPALAREAREARPRLLDGPSGLVEALTAREVEVLRLVALGRSNSQIAAELFVTVGTVKAHLHALSGKLGAANRVEAAVRAREVGILD